MLRLFRTLGAVPLLAGVAVGAQRPASPTPPHAVAAPSPGDSLTISLLTMGPGAELWELFGHDAIWIHDANTHTDSVYNWGVFNMNDSTFIVRFLRGRMLYMMEGAPLEWTLYQYRAANRTVWRQVLDLTSAEKLAIRDFIQWNEQPQNVQYRYNYFTDDCATRARDVIDRAVGGAVHARLGAEMTGATYRSNALRVMQRFLPVLLVTGVDIGLGRPTDHQLSAWDDSFLPARFMVHLRDVTLDGGSRHLVKTESVLLQGTRPPEPAEPPTLWPWLLAMGLLVGALIIVSSRAGLASTPPQVAAVVVIATWALIIGFVGTILTLLWVATDHVAAHANENVLLFNPLWLIVAVGLPFGLARRRVGRFVEGVTFAATGLTGCGLFLHVVMLSRQSNWPLIALTLPPALAIGWAATAFAAPRADARLS